MNVLKPKSWTKALYHVGSEVLGWCLVIAGIVLMPLPGPGALILLAGIVLLSNNYHWARRVRDKMKGGVIEGTKASVATKKRISVSAVATGAVMAFGFLISQDPVIPDAWHFNLLGLQFGPHIPGAGVSSGIFIIASALLSLGLLIYGVAKFRKGDSGT